MVAYARLPFFVPSCLPSMLLLLLLLLPQALTALTGELLEKFTADTLDEDVSAECRQLLTDREVAFVRSTPPPIFVLPLHPLHPLPWGSKEVLLFLAFVPRLALICCTSCAP